MANKRKERLLISVPESYCEIPQDLMAVKAPAVEACAGISALPPGEGKGVNQRLRIYPRVSKPQCKHLQTEALDSAYHSKKFVCSHVLSLLQCSNTPASKGKVKQTQYLTKLSVVLHLFQLSCISNVS